MTEKLDIKNLAKALKGGRSPLLEEQDREGKEQTEIKDVQKEGELLQNENKALAPKKGKKGGSDTSDDVKRLKSLVEEVNKIDHFNISEPVYIDSDIHEVLKKLKVGTKLKISSLVSYLLEEFLNKNREAIIELTKTKTNKYLG